MPLWGANNTSNNAPKYATTAGAGGQSGYSANLSTAHGLNIFGVPANKEANTHHAQHAGWQHVVFGTGPIKSITISAGGDSYANTDVIETSTGVQVGTLTTNSTGGIINTAITSTALFANVSLVVNTSTGSNGALSATLGGRAGRVQYETLVATGSLSANGANTEFSTLP